MSRQRERWPTVIWAVVAVASASPVWYVLAQASTAHSNYDHDSDIGFTTWHFQFRWLQVVAAALLAVNLLAGWLAMRSGDGAPRRRLVVAAPGAALAAVNLLVVVAIQRARTTWADTGDPSGWLRWAAVGLTVQAVVALSLVLLHRAGGESA